MCSLPESGTTVRDCQDDDQPCSAEYQSQLLLQEFTEFCQDFNTWKQKASERVTTIETVVESSVVGNG